MTDARHKCPQLSRANHAQAVRTLLATQQAVDFRPPDDAMPETRSTIACMLLGALLNALYRAATSHLHGANAESFNAEVGFFNSDES